jgi:hypothetical protein
MGRRYARPDISEPATSAISPATSARVVGRATRARPPTDMPQPLNRSV